jgi:type I restriction enzyme R subunit
LGVGKLIRRFKSNANMADEHEDIEAYINTLEIGSPLDVEEIKQGYERSNMPTNNPLIFIK